MFITEPRLGKGLDSLINAKALIEYFGKGIPVEKTISNADSIWDFIKFQKIGKQFNVMWNNEPQQHINRFYVSARGAYLYKVKTQDKINKRSGVMGVETSQQNVLKGFGVKLFNEYVHKEMTEYDIQYSYYINQANKIIAQLEPEQLSLF